MELKDFVTATLVQIQQGVQDAIAQASELKLNGVINPIWSSAESYDPTFIQQVSFDVAVTVMDKAGGSKGGGLNVWSVQLGAESSSETENSHVSRIQFAVPLIPPATKLLPTPHGGVQQP